MRHSRTVVPFIVALSTFSLPGGHPALMLRS